MMKKKRRPIGGLSRKFKFRPLVVCFLILFLAIPLYPKFPLINLRGTYVRIRLEDWLVFLFLGVWFFLQAKENFPIFRQKIFKLFLLYWLVGLISWLNAAMYGRGTMVSVKIGLLHFLRRIEYMSLFFLAYDAFANLHLGEFIFSSVLVSLFVFAYGMGQKYFGLPVISTMNEEFSKGLLLRLDRWTRINSTFAGHYDLAAWLVLLLPLFPAFVAVSKKKIVKAGLILGGLLNFYLLTLTASRISFVAYLGGISVTLLLLRAFWWWPLVLTVSLFFGLQSEELNARLASSFKFITRYEIRLPQKKTKIISPSPTPLPSPTPTVVALTKKKSAGRPQKESMMTSSPSGKVIKEVQWWPKPEEVGVAAARSSQIRFRVEWPRAIRAFLRHPLLGSGYSSLGLATDNDYLRCLGETGLLGFFSFLLILFHLAKRGVYALLRQKQLIMAGFLGTLAGFLANAVFIDVFEASKDAFCFWLLMGGMYRLSTKLKATKSL